MARHRMTIPYFRRPNVCHCGDHAFVGLTRGLVALASPDSVGKLAAKPWSVVRSGRTFYARSHLWVGEGGKRTIYMHRLLAGGSGLEVDHRNGDGLDNRTENLRQATRAQNCQNTGLRGASSGFKGVSKQKDGKFRAAIRIRMKSVHLGTFSDPLDAASAYDAAARKLHGEFAQTNEALGLLPPAYQVKHGKSFAFGGGLGIAIVEIAE